MEAVPRMPMISFELKTSCETPSFGPKLKQYIRDFYNEDGESYNTEIRQLETLRAQAVAAQKSVSCCAVLKRYFCQLHFLQSRFPMTQDAAACVAFSWSGVHSGPAEGDVRHEMASVLHNVAALHTQLGADDARANADGMKMCCTHFQCAAWAFQHLREAFPEPSGTDMAANLLAFMERLCLAQAQECILEKSMTDSRKPTIVAKVAVQVVEYYAQALTQLEQGGDGRGLASVQDIVGTKQFKVWRRYVKFKGVYHEVLSLLYHGQQAEEQQKNGERVAFYQAAADKLKEATKLAKGLDLIETVNEGLALRHDVIEGKLKGARNENEFIYHEEVPELSALTLQKGASLVKGIAFSVDDPEIAGPDLFGRLVPMEAHQAASLYSEEMAALRRKMGQLVDDKDAELADFVSALRLDQLELHNQSNALPQELVDRCAALNARPGAAQALTEAVAKLSESCAAVDAMLTQAEQLLQREQEEERRHRSALGPDSASRPPSIAATDLSRECAKYRTAHDRAAESNATLRKALAQHLPGLQTLAGPLDELPVGIPSMGVLNSSADEASIAEMRRLAAKVGEMTTQRATLSDTLRAATARDDITAALVTRDPKLPLESLFQREMQKHQRVVSTLEQNLAAQANVLAALTEANARYAPTRRAAVEIQRSRDTVIAGLLAAYDACQDLHSKSAKGLEFYRKLETNVSKLLQRVKGTCNVQDEERAQIQASLGGVKSGPTTSHPKLKDYLNDAPGPRLKDYLSQPPLAAGADEGGQRWPSVRPAPVGQEGSDQACSAGQSRPGFGTSHQSYGYDVTKGTPSNQSFAYDASKGTPSYQSYGYDPTKAAPAYQTYGYDATKATPTHQTYAYDPTKSTPTHQSYAYDTRNASPARQSQGYDPSKATPTHQSQGYDPSKATPTHQSQGYDPSKATPTHQSQGYDQPPSYASQFGPAPSYQDYAPAAPSPGPAFAATNQIVFPAATGQSDATSAMAALSLANQTSYAQAGAYGAQTQTGYPSQAGTSPAQTGYSTQTGINPGQTVYSASSGASPVQTGYSAQTGTYSGLPATQQAGYPGQIGTTADQTGSYQTQSGYAAQSGVYSAQTGSQAGNPAQGAAYGSYHTQAGYPAQTGSNASQAGYGTQTGSYPGQAAGYPEPTGAAYQGQSGTYPGTQPPGYPGQTATMQQGAASYGIQSDGYGSQTGSFTQPGQTGSYTQPGQTGAYGTTQTGSYSQPGQTGSYGTTQTGSYAQPGQTGSYPQSSVAGNNPQVQSQYGNYGNTTYPDANALYSNTNASYSNTNGSFPNANTSYTNANTSYANANTSYANANTSYTNANTSYPNANTSYTTANTSYPNANTSYTNENTSYANTISSYPNANASYPSGTSYANANASYSNTGTSYADANASYSNTGTSYADANASYSNTGTSYADANAYGNTDSAYSNANPAHANPAYANPAHANPAHANPAHANTTANVSYPGANIQAQGSAFGGQPSSGTYVTAATSTTAGLASSSSVDLLAGLDFTAGPLPLTPSNQGAASSPSANQGTASSQPANQGTASSQLANQGAASSQPANQAAASSQPANQGTASSQPANQGAASSQLSIQSLVSSQPANESAAESESTNREAASEGKDAVAEVKSLDSPKREPKDGVAPKDPYSEPEALRQLAAEVDKLDKFVEGLTAKTLNGPTPLDLKWKELLDLQEREGARRSISVARCYPTKNRCADVLPYDDSRVELPGTKDDYINASHVTGLTGEAPAVIATQFPLPSTLSDFWTMVWQQQTELVVCLLGDAELPDAAYWPEERGSPRECAEFRVALQSREVSTHVTRRIVTLSCARGSRNLVLLQLTSWPGSSFPASPVGLLTCVRDALWLRSQQRGVARPLVVHCFAGVGRTGLFCLLLAAIATLDQGRGVCCLSALAARLGSARRQALRDREHLRFAYAALLYHAQDVLLKRGVLGGRPGSFDGKRARHARHPSDDFVLAADSTPSASCAANSSSSLEPAEDSTQVSALPSTTAAAAPEDPLGSLDPYWRLKRPA